MSCVSHDLLISVALGFAVVMSYFGACWIELQNGPIGRGTLGLWIGLVRSSVVVVCY